LKRAMESLRDWGRDCWCAPGDDNTCRKRFRWQLGDLPAGYDHKYIYSHAGYNLKITDMQAAVGCAQMEHLSGFIERRKANFRHLCNRLAEAGVGLLLPHATPNSEPSWFGFPITLAPGLRPAMLQRLAEAKIGTRLLFGGNLIRQPYFAERHYRVSGDLANTDRIVDDTFWVGIYPGLTEQMLDYVADTILDQLRRGAA